MDLASLEEEFQHGAGLSIWEKGSADAVEPRRVFQNHNTMFRENGSTFASRTSLILCVMPTEFYEGKRQKNIQHLKGVVTLNGIRYSIA